MTQLLSGDAIPDYFVQSVSGRVEWEAGAGTWEPVRAGMRLAPSTVVNTGLDSFVVLRGADGLVTLKAMQKGTLEKLIASLGATKSGIRIGAEVLEGSTGLGEDTEVTNISTAATRGSDATEDSGWAN